MARKRKLSLVLHLLGLTCILAIQMKVQVGMKKGESKTQKEITGRDINLEVTGIMIIYKNHRTR